MRGKTRLAALITAVALSLVLIVAGLAGAHGRSTQAGLSFVFGGTDEPLITGIRSWLELNVVDAQSEEPVDGLADNLSLTIANGEWSRKLGLAAVRNKPGTYRAPAWFITPGKYTFIIEGQNLAGEPFKLEYQLDVGDHRELFFPAR